MADSTKPTTGVAAANPYNPCQDLDTPIKKLYYLPTSPEHLYPEKAPKPYRPFGDNLVSCTGICYLSGRTAGIVHGGVRGLKAAGAGEPRRVRMSRALSSGGELGRRYSNAMGIVGLYFSVIEGWINCYRGKNGILNTGVAGFGAGEGGAWAEGGRSCGGDRWCFGCGGGFRENGGKEVCGRIGYLGVLRCCLSWNGQF